MLNFFEKKCTMISWQRFSMDVRKSPFVVQDPVVRVGNCCFRLSIHPLLPGNHIPVFFGAASSPQPSYSSCSLHGIDPTRVYTAQTRGARVILAQGMSIFHLPGQGHQFRDQHETQPSKRDSIQGSLLEPLERRSTLAKMML